MIEKCSAERDPTQVDEGENGSVLGCKQVLCLHLWGYYFECKDLAEVLGYLVQLNYIFNREYPSQVRSLLKFITHLHGATMSLSTAQKNILR